MFKSQRIAKALTIIVAALLLNVLACSKAKFEATEPTNRQTQPSPDNVTTNQTQDPGSGNVVNCSNVNSVFCNNNDDGFQDTVPPLTFPVPYCDIKEPIPVNNKTCYSNTFKNSTTQSIDGISMWLIVDSSRSFDQARMAVGRAVAKSFMASLNHQVPVTISVIPSHLRSSSYGTAHSFNGSIYGQVTITSSTNYHSAMNTLLSFLDSTMQESPVSLAKRDRTALDNLNYANGVSGAVWDGPNSGSDEMGLHSFMAAMSLISVPATHGWVVMFLADENDVCTPELNYDGSQYFSHINEREIYSKGHCNGVSPAAAYTKAQAYAGTRPFAIGAMTFLQYATIPTPTPGTGEVQWSVGVGYTDIAGLAKTQGVLMDLAAGTTQGFETVATRLVQGLGQVTNNSVGFHTHYPLYYPNGSRVNLKDVLQQNVNGQLTMDLRVYVGQNEQQVDFYNPNKSTYRSDYSYDSQQSLIMPVNKNTVTRIEFCVAN